MLAFDGVGKRYGRSWALRDVTLELRPGRRLAVVGPNAAGKTTLLDLASGLSRPSEGDLTLDGRPVADQRTDLKARVGYVGHDPGLYDALTVDEMLRFHADVRGIDADDRIDALIDRFGLAARRHDRIRTLSRGLVQRTALAYALVSDPPVLLLDEPYTGLDVDARRDLTDLLDATRDRLVVVTAHDVGDVPDPDRVVLLDGGRVAFNGPPGEAVDAQAKVYGGIR